MPRTSCFQLSRCEQPFRPMSNIVSAFAIRFQLTARERTGMANLLSSRAQYCAMRCPCLDRVAQHASHLRLPLYHFIDPDRGEWRGATPGDWVVEIGRA